MVHRGVVVILVATAGSAEAGPGGVMAHANAGLEVMGDGNDAIELAARFHLGASWAIGTGSIRPSVALGGTAAIGRLDPPGEGPTAAYTDYGPELQLGVRIGDGGCVDNRIFAGVAYLRAGDAGDAGNVLRVTLGGSLADWSGRVATERGPHASSRGFLLLIMPQQIELGWTHGDGADRFGVTLSYGI